MLGLLRLMSGRRLLIAAILVVLVLSGSTALRTGAAQLLACSSTQCLHEVTRDVTAATAWLRTHRDAGQDPPRGVPPIQQP